MADVVLKFANDEQYQKFINDIKESVVKEIKENHNEPARNGWEIVKKEYLKESSKRARLGPVNPSGEKVCQLPDRPAFFEMCKSAFGTRHSNVANLNSFPESELRSFKNELISLIEKYHSKNAK